MPLRLDGRTGGEEKEKETEREAEVQRCRYGKRRSPGLWIVPGVCGVVAMFHSLPSTPWNELWNSFSPPFFLLNYLVFNLYADSMPVSCLLWTLLVPSTAALRYENSDTSIGELTFKK